MTIYGKYRKALLLGEHTIIMIVGATIIMSVTTYALPAILHFAGFEFFYARFFFAPVICLADALNFSRHCRVAA